MIYGLPIRPPMPFRDDAKVLKKIILKSWDAWEHDCVTILNPKTLFWRQSDQ
jgi:hypothetical protein